MYTKFRTNKLEKMYLKRKAGIKGLGDRQYKKYSQRIAELHASDNLEDFRKNVINARCHPLKADMVGLYAIDLVQPSRLIISPICDEEVFDEKFVLGVKIHSIEEDYH